MRGTKFVIFATAPVFILLSTQAHSLEPASRYYCKDEAMGGIVYNKELDSFVGTRFRPKDSFILSLNRNAADTGAPRYDVKITDEGSSNSFPCLNYSVDGRIPFVTTGGVLRCTSSLTEHIFDFSTNRYLKAYMYGYTDGEKDNSNTPSITGGICTKID